MRIVERRRIWKVLVEQPAERVTSFISLHGKLLSTLTFATAFPLTAHQDLLKLRYPATDWAVQQMLPNPTNLANLFRAQQRARDVEPPASSARNQRTACLNFRSWRSPA